MNYDILLKISYKSILREQTNTSNEACISKEPIELTLDKHLSLAYGVCIERWLLNGSYLRMLITTSTAYQFSRRVYLTPKSSIDPQQTIWSQEENLQNLCGPEIRGWSIRTCLPPLFLSLSLSAPGLYTLLKVNDFLALCLHTGLWGQSVLKMKWYNLFHAASGCIVH